MYKWRMILAVIIVGLGSAAIRTWHEGSQHPDATLARAETPAPLVQQSHLAATDQVAVSDVSSVPPAAAPAPAASEGAPIATNVAVEPPPVVDTPEPAERKFAGGGHAQDDQN